MSDPPALSATCTFVIVNGSMPSSFVKRSLTCDPPFDRCTISRNVELVTGRIQRPSASKGEDAQLPTHLGFSGDWETPAVLAATSKTAVEAKASQCLSIKCLCIDG